MNKLLEKQIKNHLTPELLEKEQIQRFLDAVNNSYNSYERDRTLSAHAFHISEQEYAIMNQQLQQEIELKKIGIKNLKETITCIEGPGKEHVSLDEDEDNLLFALSYLKESVARQKKMEAELKDSESRLSASSKTFSQLIKNLHNGLVVEDADRKIVLVNQLFCDIMGISLAPEMMTGMDCGEASKICGTLFSDTHEFLIRVEELLAGRKLVTNEELQMIDGRVLIRDYVPIFVDNEFKGNLWKFKDVTREREISTDIRRLSLVASVNENGVLFTDPQGVIFWANEGFLKLTGYSCDEIMGNTPIALCKGDLSNKEELKEMLAAFYAGANFTIEVVLYRKDGSYFWGRVKGQSILDENQQVIQYFAMIEDITAQKKMELDLIEAKEQAEESSLAKETFLGNMSHEIRTPMNAILGMCRQLKRTDLSSSQRFYLDTVYSAAENLLVVINDILDITKIDAGKLDLENIGFQLKEVLSRATQVMQHKAQEKGLDLSFSLDESIHPVLIGDPFRLNQILLNLIGNALKFTSKGSVFIECKASGPLNLGQSQCVSINIKDTGIGMTVEFMDRLFDKFSQEDRSVTRKYGGTGLGMSICKQLVELMNGTITIRSQKGEGTEMILLIPFKKGQANDLQKEEEIITDPSVFRGKRLLLVEDNDMNRLIAVTVLNNYGATIVEATNGAEGLKAMQKADFDLILMDVQMPVMDGLEATRKIRKELGSSIPVIAFTASAIKGEIEKCFAAGMNDFVSKPFEEEKLVRTIAHWLGHLPSVHGGTKPEPPETALYDLSALLSAGRGNREFAKKMISLFLKQVPAAIKQMQTANADRDIDYIRKTAHRIKPLFHNLGVKCLQDEMTDLEKLQPGDEDAKRAFTILKKSESIVSEIATGLAKEFGLNDQYILKNA